MDAKTIQHLIELGLPGATVQVEGDDGVHFHAIVTSAAFRGKLPLAQHRMVYATLGNRLAGAIHALQLTTRTPDDTSTAPV